MVSAGRLADRQGRKRAFLWGLAIFVLGSALCGIAPSVETLVGARVIQAVGAALLLPTSLALLLPEFEPKERSQAIGIWAAIGGLAAAAGPPVGGLLVEVSWRLVFLVNVPIGLVAIAYGLRLLHESRDETQERPDMLGSGLVIASVGVLALGLVKGPEWGWSDPRTIAALAAAAVGLAAFWARCLTHRSPVIDPAPAARALVRAREPRLGAVLGGVRGVPAGQRALHDDRLARVRDPRGAVALPRAHRGIDGRLHVRAPPQPLRPPRVRDARNRAVRARLPVVEAARRRDAGLRDRDAPGPDRRGHRRRLRAPEPRQRLGLLGAARALRHRIRRSIR